MSSNNKPKIYLLSFIIGIMHLNCSAQLEYFLPDSGAIFSVHDFKFFFSSDTVIEDNIYKKVFYTYREEIPDFEKAKYYAAVREDTLNERIYFYQPGDPTERLLADFSLQPGDTITIYSFAEYNLFYAGRIPVEVFDVDSVEINGNYRKAVVFQYWNGLEYWIEGIGSTCGLFFPAAGKYPSDASALRLLCIHENGELIYDNPDYEGCYIKRYVGIKEEVVADAAFYPTITEDYVHIEFDRDIRKAKYVVLSTEGKIVSSGTCKENFSISLASFANGMYIIHLVYDDLSVITQKIIKK